MVFAVAVYIAGFVSSIADPDLWGFLAFGHLFWTEPGFPYQDVFSYMPVKDVWVYHEWLTGVVFFPLYASLGPISLLVLRYILAGASLWLVYAIAVKRGSSPFWAVACLFLTGYAICAGWNPVRAQVFTYFFFVLVLYVCESARKNQAFGRLWLLIPIFILWCNLHGGFLAGLGIVALFAVGEAVSKRKFFPYTIVFAACAASTLINPYGVKYWQYLAGAIAMPRPEIAEWMSMPGIIREGFKPLLALTWFLLAAIIIFACAIRLKKDATAILVLGATALMAFLHMRHIVFFALAFAVYIPAIATRISPQHLKNNAKLKQGGDNNYMLDFAPQFNLHQYKKWGRVYALQRIATIVAVAAFLCLSCLNVLVTVIHFVKAPALPRFFALEAPPFTDVSKDETFYPIGGMNYLLQKKISGNILTEYDWGQFILWTMPKCRVAMDGRYETVYTEHTRKAYFDFFRGKPGWQNYLGANPHQIAILRPKSMPRFLIATIPDWEMKYIDKGCVVFVRKKAAFLPNK